MKIINDEIYEAFEKLLEENGGSRDAVAQYLGLTPLHIWRVLKGEISHFQDDTWVKIFPKLSPYLPEPLPSRGVNISGRSRVKSKAIIGSAGVVNHGGVSCEEKIEKFRSVLIGKIIDLDVDSKVKDEILKLIKNTKID